MKFSLYCILCLFEHVSNIFSYLDKVTNTKMRVSIISISTYGSSLHLKKIIQILEVENMIVKDANDLNYINDYH